MAKQLTLSQFNNLRLSNFSWFQLLAGHGSSEPGDRKPTLICSKHEDCNDMLADMADLKKVEAKEIPHFDYYIWILNHKVRGSYEYRAVFEHSSLN